MDSRIFKVFVSCALGSGIGSLIALSMHQYFWWVGLLAGGAIGYLTYEFKKVIRAVPTAWSGTWNMFVSPSFRNGSFAFFAATLFGISVCSSIFLAFLYLQIYHPMETYPSFFAGWGFLGMSLGGSLGLSALLVSFLMIQEGSFKTITTPGVLKLAILATPPGLAFLLVRALFVGLKSMPIATRFSAVFVKKFFVLIHSDIRLLCGVDAAIGAGTGYFLGNPLIGAFVGGAIGVANFEILSRRVLRLVPKQ